jgi:hypothetical protein
VEGEFWKASPANHVETDRARRQIAFVIERALAEALITHRDVVEAIGVAELATRLPRSELGKLVERALDAGHRGTPFTESELLAMLPPAEIVRMYRAARVGERRRRARRRAARVRRPTAGARPDAAAARGDPPAAPASLAEVDAAGAAATAVARPRRGPPSRRRRALPRGPPPEGRHRDASPEGRRRSRWTRGESDLGDRDGPGRGRVERRSELADSRRRRAGDRVASPGSELGLRGDRRRHPIT